MTTYNCASPDDVAELYARTGPLALSKVMKLIGNLSVAQELVQDVFLRLWEKGPTFSSQGAAYLWVYQSCHHAAVDHLRRHGTRLPHVSADATELIDPAARPPDRHSADRDLALRLTSSLSQREAEVLVYTSVEGLTQGEVAEVMGLSRKTVGRLITTVDGKLARAKERWRGR